MFFSYKDLIMVFSYIHLIFLPFQSSLKGKWVIEVKQSNSDRVYYIKAKHYMLDSLKSNSNQAYPFSKPSSCLS